MMRICNSIKRGHFSESTTSSAVDPHTSQRTAKYHLTYPSRYH